MVGLIRILLHLMLDVGELVLLACRARRSIAAENLVLRRQLALYKERGIRPRRIDGLTRLSLGWLSRWSDWRLVGGSPARNGPAMAPCRLAVNMGL